MTKRERALRVAISQIGVHESGVNNRGARIEIYQSADNLPGVGYAWCMSFMQWCWKKARGLPLANGTASVGFFVGWAREENHIVTRPLRGDFVTFYFDGDNWADHVGIVERVLRLGPTWYLQTIEGNTGPLGAVSDPGTGRDGVYRKRRAVQAGRGTYIRVPGTLANAATPAVVPKPKRFLLRRRPTGIVYTEPQ